MNPFLSWLTMFGIAAGAFVFAIAVEMVIDWFDGPNGPGAS